jgi:hypothetical protein
MTRPKKKSAILSLVEKRLAGMKSINPFLDLGSGCSVSTIESQIIDVRQKLEDYHALLSKVDAAANDLDNSEKQLASLSNKILLGTAWQYGKESNEYEMVGGVRPSDSLGRRRQRKRPRRQLAEPAAV